MPAFFKAPKTKTLLWTLCAILAVLVVFGLGVAVGYRRALFASDFGESYYRVLYGEPFGKAAIGFTMGPGPATMHGVTGQVIDVSSATISVEDPQGDEQLVAIASGTPIREMDSFIVPGDIEVGDMVTVIGSPDNEGQVEARFIRVFETSSSPPMPASAAMPVPMPMNPTMTVRIINQNP